VPDDPRAERRHDYPELRILQTRWADQDVYGHVNNAVHYQLLDTAVNAWLIEATGTDIRALPAVGVVAETSCRYLSELHFPQPVTVGLRLDRLGNSSVRYGLALFAEDETPAAVASFVHVYVDEQTRRPVPVPQVIRTALARLERR
jgi:acyl-CoA thioester hydrolase